MRQVCCLYEANLYNKPCLFDTVIPRKIDSALPVEDILYLQEIFLTAGLHHILVSDIASGRIIVGRLLKSMNYHHEIACLTNTWDPPLKKTVLDLYNSAIHYCGDNASYDQIEEFFIEQYFADFMWVEISKSLLQIPFVGYVLQAMHELDLAHNMSIVVLSYHNEPV